MPDADVEGQGGTGGSRSVGGSGGVGIDGGAIFVPSDAAQDVGSAAGGVGDAPIAGAGGVPQGVGGANAAGSTPVIPPAGTNLVTNAGFENGTTGWTKQDGQGGAASPGHTGTFCLHEPKKHEWWWQNIDYPQPGKSYTFSAWAKSPMGGCLLGFDAGRIGGGQGFRFESAPAGTEWTQLTFQYKMPVDVGWLQVVLIAGDAQCSYDDVVVKMN